MEIIKEFGVDPVLLIAQIINFLIILFILKKFLYKPIFTMLQNRKNEIQESVRQAEKTRELLEKTGEKEKEILKKAQEESKKILEETRKLKNNIIAEAEDAAKIQTQKILTEAKKQIETETAEAKKALSLQITETAELILKKSVSQMFNEEDQQKIIKRAIEQLKKGVD
jgi:F-type H+-transporting ATPase subunit b